MIIFKVLNSIIGNSASPFCLYTNTNIPILKPFFNASYLFFFTQTQVSNAVRHATESSIVILDEFGKGTESVDGQALLCATLTYWLRHTCPHVFVSTHYHSVIQHKYLPRSPLIRYQV